MTEAEWLACNDPRPMLKFLRAKAGDRKIRLFAAACCRRAWHHIKNEQRRHAVVVAEQYAEGTVGEDDLTKALDNAVGGEVTSCVEYAACWAANKRTAVLHRIPFEVAKAVASTTGQSASSSRWKNARDAELLVQASLLRCIFGNPERNALAIEPAWLAWHASTVKHLAQGVYQDRLLPAGTLDAGRLAVLADALEEAGCDNKEMLGHLREPNGVHVRGCWALDLILSKDR